MQKEFALYISILIKSELFNFNRTYNMLKRVADNLLPIYEGIKQDVARQQ